MKRVLTLAQLMFVVGAVLLAAGALSIGSGTAGAVSGTTGPISVSVTPTSGLSDGQSVAVHAEAPPGIVIYELKVHLCLPGSYIGTNFNFGFEGEKCTNLAPGAGDAEKLASFPDGTQSAELDTFKVGEGGVHWVNALGDDQVIMCGPGQPCDLVVRVQLTNDTRFYTAPLCYGDGCPPDGQTTNATTPAAAGAATPPPAAASSSAAGGISGAPTASTTASHGAKVTSGESNSSTANRAGLDNGNQQAVALDETTAGAAGGLSRPVRVFVAAAAGAICMARIITVIKRTRRRTTGGLGTA